jgi:hypothetical protein
MSFLSLGRGEKRRTLSLKVRYDLDILPDSQSASQPRKGEFLGQSVKMLKVSD